MENLKVLKLSKEGLKDAIAGLSQLKPVLQQRVKELNKSKEQGDIDSRQLGEHFTTAINSMATVLVMMDEMKEKSRDTKENEVSEEIKEEIMKEYAEDLYEEFNQVARCEGKITMKDVTDILQLNEDCKDKIIIGNKYKLKGSKSEVTITSIGKTTVGVIFDSDFEGEVNISKIDI